MDDSPSVKVTLKNNENLPGFILNDEYEIKPDPTPYYKWSNMVRVYKNGKFRGILDCSRFGLMRPE